MPPKRKRVENDDDDEQGAPESSKSSEKGPKRRKAKEKAAEPAEEKRLARFRDKCPQVIQGRVERVKTQRFYMIERERQPGELKEKFKVLGSTGNVYTVTIDNIPSCNCPDFLKGNYCKHLIFVFLKILGVEESGHFYFQKALLTSELETIFTKAPPAPTAIANQRLASAYAQSTGKAESSASDQASSSEVNPKRDVDGQDCAVCYEEMQAKTQDDLSKLIFCDLCNNALHTDCFRMWSMSKNPVTCVYCRAPWPSSEANGFDGTIPNEGYLNLSKAAGVSTKRDTSTYYHGPRKGQRWRGRNDYY